MLINLEKKISSKSGKSKWHTIEKNINKVTLNKQAIGDMERDMERLLAERETLGKEMDRLKKQRNQAVLNRIDTTDIDNEIDSVKSNIEYVQDSITEAQHHIMQIEETKVKKIKINLKLFQYIACKQNYSYRILQIKMTFK